uniref:(northern house mosquito) hypothetical protein n=1 Tax=Culex pipiens TaxID=7175 RepID=A0A8D8C3M6_CULPI
MFPVLPSGIRDRFYCYDIFSLRTHCESRRAESTLRGNIRHRTSTRRQTTYVRGSAKDGIHGHGSVGRSAKVATGRRLGSLLQQGLPVRRWRGNTVRHRQRSNCMDSHDRHPPRSQVLPESGKV